MLHAQCAHCFAQCELAKECSTVSSIRAILHITVMRFYGVVTLARTQHRIAALHLVTVMLTFLSCVYK